MNKNMYFWHLPGEIYGVYVLFYMPSSPDKDSALIIHNVLSAVTYLFNQP